MMSKHHVFPFVLVICLVSETFCVADEEVSSRQIQQWVRQLGDDSFLVRERAESFLIRAGIRAYSELHRVRQASDVEIVRRAEYILSQVEQAFLAKEHRDVAPWIQNYIRASNPAFKARIIWLLADPLSDLSQGEGLQTLCRLVQFEENGSLRIEAAKSLIASPPFSPAHRQQWYRYIRDNIRVTDEDELLQCLSRYATLWCDLDDAKEKTSSEWRERVRQSATETLQLLDRKENGIQVGSKIDLLLHYAVAEFHDTVGQTEDRDKVISLALAMEPRPMQTVEPVDEIFSAVPDYLQGSEHCYVGFFLKGRYRLHGAIAHFRQVMENGDIFLRTLASEEAAGCAIYLADYPAAIDFFDKHIELLKSPDYTKNFNDSSPRVTRAQKRKAYCGAAKAADDEDWEGVQKFILEGWAISKVPDNTVDTELVILAHRLCKQKEDVGTAFRETMYSRLKQCWQAIESELYPGPPDERAARMAQMGNNAAWLLANTGGRGDYPSAVTLIETTLKSESDNAVYLDTLAHVHFLGGKIDEAIQTQELTIRLAPEVVLFQQALERFKQTEK